MIESQNLSERNLTLAAEWHPTRNGDLLLTDMSVGSGKRVWWQCSRGHEWDATISIRNSGNNCPYCGNKKILIGYNDLLTTHPQIAAEWHHTLNSDLTPDMFSFGSRKRVWWQCTQGHEWDAAIKRRRAHGCPYCAGNRILPGYNDLVTTTPELAGEWHPTKNGELTPDQVGKGTIRLIWWICAKDHEWQATANARTGSGPGCPYCGNKKILIGYNDLASQYPLLAGEWHPTRNGDFTAKGVTPGSNKKVWWICPKGHEWQAIVGNRVREGYGCSNCSSSILVSRGEQEIADYLTQELELNIEQSNRKILHGLELDIYIPEKNLAIEYNGLYWHSTIHQKDSRSHQIKYERSRDAGIQLIQVWEDEWINKSELVKILLAHKLGVSNKPLVGARNTIIQKTTLAEAKTFLEEYHLQGHVSGSYYLSLREKNTNRLVAIMILVKRHNEMGVTLEIVRYATSTRVPGGFTKLLKHVETTFQPSRLVTFADHCISDGGLYEQNGFIAEKEVKPDYRYLVKGKRLHKFGYRLKRFKSDPSLLWEPGLTETQLAELNGLHRIYDAGKTRWTKEL